MNLEMGDPDGGWRWEVGWQGGMVAGWMKISMQQRTAVGWQAHQHPKEQKQPEQNLT